MRASARAAAAFGLAVTLVIAVAGCGGSAATSSASSAASSSTSAASPTSSTSSTSSTSTTSTTSTTSSQTTRPRPRRPGKAVGQAQLVHAGSSTLSVAVTRVIDPLRDSGAAPLPGTRAVGVAITVHNLRGETYDSTASGDVSIVPSSGTAAPLFIKQGVCQTPLTDFESLIGVGETHSGCVGFTVPKGARIVEVRYSPHSRRRGTVSWH